MTPLSVTPGCYTLSVLSVNGQGPCEVDPGVVQVQWRSSASFVPCTLGVFASQMRHGLPAASVAIGL